MMARHSLVNSSTTVRHLNGSRRTMSITAKKDEIEQRRVQVAHLLKGGVDRRGIAKTLGISLATVWRDAVLLRRRWREEQAAEIADAAALDLARIDDCIIAITNPVRSGNLAAIKVLVSLLERRAAILGYDAPKRIEQRLHGGVEPFIRDAYDRLIRDKEQALMQEWTRSVPSYSTLSGGAGNGSTMPQETRSPVGR